MADSKTAETEHDIQTELQALKDDLMAVKEDIGKVTSSAVNQGKATASAVKEQASDGVNQGLESARTYVQEKPITSALVALGVGVGIGLMLGRR